MLKNYQALLKVQPDLALIKPDNFLWYTPQLATIDVDLADNHAQFIASKFPSGFKLDIEYRIFDSNSHLRLDTKINNLDCNNPYSNKMFVASYVKANSQRLNGLVLPYPAVKDTLELEIVERWSYDFNNLYIDAPFKSRPFTHVQRVMIKSVEMSKMDIDNRLRRMGTLAMEMDRRPNFRIDDYFDFSSLNLQSILLDSQFLYFTSEGHVLNQTPIANSDIFKSALNQLRNRGFELKPDFKAGLEADIKRPFHTAMFCGIVNYQGLKSNQNGYNHNGFGSMLIDISETMPKFKSMIPFTDLKAKQYPNAYDFEDKYLVYVPKFQKTEA